MNVRKVVREVAVRVREGAMRTGIFLPVNLCRHDVTVIRILKIYFTSKMLRLYSYGYNDVLCLTVSIFVFNQ